MSDGSPLGPEGGAPEISSSDPSSADDSGGPSLGRRSFVQRTLLGAAAFAAARPSDASASKRAPQEAPSRPVPDPATAEETWDEPWIWRPGDFPGEALQLNIVEHENPTVIVGMGNPGPAIFTYNGSTPGPTIRVRGDGTYLLRLVNHLGLNAGRSTVGPAPDLGGFLVRPDAYPPGVDLRPDWCIGEHTNGLHSAHTTNMHVHGLHVRPGTNEDGTHSDNIFVRLIPRADFRNREADVEERCDSLDANHLLEDEQVATGQWEFRLGNVEGDPNAPHPPGTHWYHPHPHGATHNQVSSGMAGFLLIEGDVDEALNRQLAGEPNPHPERKTGPFDYRERLMLLQRVSPGLASADPDHFTPQARDAAIPTINGEAAVPVLTIRPGAVERWRILNGSVDGKGYVRFMVLEGEWVNETPPGGGSGPATTLAELIRRQTQLLRVGEDGTRTIPTTEEIEAAKAHLHQLAVDGVTLVRATPDGGSEYYIRDLDFQAGPNPLRQDFTNLGACYESPETLRRCYDGPNEFYMAQGNRTDILFQAPQLEEGETARVYTVLAKATAIHTENLQRAIQLAEEDLAAGRPARLDFPPDTVMGYLVVTGDPVEGRSGFGGIGSLELPDVPSYLRPVAEGELRSEAHGGEFRTRRITYSGWGAATWPGFREEHLRPFDPDGGAPGPVDPVYRYDPDSDIPGLAAGLGLAPSVEAELRTALRSAVEGGELSLDIGHDWVVPPNLKTMAIDGRKFDPDDPDRPRMLVDTTEEWVVVNNTISLFATFDEAAERAQTFERSVRALMPDSVPRPDQTARQMARKLFTWLRNHTVGRPATRAEAERNGWSIGTRATDHPFHIHTNPFWLMRVEVPDRDGNLVNVLGAPRWQDVIWLPRNGGRVVFRSRYPDFIGKLVNHCHILQHEDTGMMQPVEIVLHPDAANFRTTATLPSLQPEGRVDQDQLRAAFRECTRFVDANPQPGRGQEYPSANGCFEQEED